jgi:hypothetical protein
MNAPLVLNHECLWVSSGTGLEEPKILKELLPSVPGTCVVELVTPGLPSLELSSSPARRHFVGRLQNNKGICSQNRGALYEMEMTTPISLFLGGGFIKYKRENF